MRKLPCTKCGSSDAVADYEDGGAMHCFSCGVNHFPDTYGQPDKPRKEEKPLEIKDLPYGTQIKRKINKEICEFFGVKAEIDTNGDSSKVYYPYYEGQILVGYKVRICNPKDFRVEGKLPTTLFGQQKFPQGGKRIVITEGEEDTLAVAYSFKERGNLYPVVSIPSASNLKAVIENRDYLRSFDEVVLYIDNDDAGKGAVEKIAKIVGYAKVKIAQGKEKDASEEYIKHGTYSVMQAIWNAQSYKPSGILSGADLWTAMVAYNLKESTPYPNCFPGLNEKLKGMRTGEITLWTSGTGAGKSTIMREIIWGLVQNTTDKIGVIALEESPAETARKMSGIAINCNPSEVSMSEEQLKEGFDKVFGDDRVMVLDHAGSMNNGIVDQLEFMALSGCKYLFIDHITILVSEGAEGLTGNEAIDKIMNDLLRISKQHDVWIGLISHLRKMDKAGKSFEDGILPSLDDIRGSGSIKQISHDIIAFARNIASESEAERNTITMKVLKSRFTGNTGPAGSCSYNQMTGRLKPTEGF